MVYENNNDIWTPQSLSLISITLKVYKPLKYLTNNFLIKIAIYLQLRQSKAENAMNKKQQQRFQSHHQNRNYGSSQMHKGKGVVHQTTSFYVGFSSTAWGQNINNNGPVALLDLNLPAEESINVASFQWLARSAQHIRRCDVNSTRKLI